MEIRRSVVLTGAALAVLLVAAVLALRDDAREPVTLAAEPELFPFLKPMTAAASSDDMSASAGDAADKNTSATQRTPTPSPLARHDVGAVSPSATDIAAVEQEVKRLRSLGAGDDEVYRARALALSADAAARLSNMEQAENTWRARIDLYLAERARLLAMYGNTDGTTQPESLQQLRNAFFTADEQERLAAYEPPLAPQLTMN